MLFLIFILILAVGILSIALLLPEEIKSARDKDPAAKNHVQIILMYSGLHAIVAYKAARFLWKLRVPLLPRAISQCVRFLTGIEIHPGAAIHPGLFIDHGMGVVIGETTVIGKNVTLFQGVTLGGTGKETGKRHPTLGDNIVVGAGAKVLGNITVGSNSYIGANAVVIKDVPANTTIVGVPGRITKQDGKRIDKNMDHIHILDPVMQHINELRERIEQLEGKGPKK